MLFDSHFLSVTNINAFLAEKRASKDKEEVNIMKKVTSHGVTLREIVLILYFYLFILQFRFCCFPILDFNTTNSAKVVYIVCDHYHLVL